MRPLIVAIGASNTAGYGVGIERAYPAVLERILRQRGHATEVRNAGVSGETTGQMLARLDRELPDGTRIVVFQPGSNDARLGISDVVRDRNIEIIQARLAARGIPVVRVAAALEAARAGNLQADGVHFTARGHERIAQLLVDRIAGLLADGLAK